MTDLDLLLAAADATTDRSARGDTSDPSPYQERLWRAHLAATPTAYSVPCVFELDGGDSGEVLAAILAVLASESVFDTRIADRAGAGFQLVPAGPVTPEIIEVADGDVDETTERIVARPWTSGPLVRVALLRPQTRAHRVVLVFHHAVVDGHSVSLLVADIARTLSAPGADTGTARPRYHDVARVRPESASWWRGHLAAVRYRDAWRPDGTGSTVVTRGPVTADGTVDAAAWLTGIAITLSRLLGAQTLALSVPLANRREVEEFDVVGPLVNTVPLVIEVRNDEPVAVLHRRVERLLGGAVEHADADLASVVTDIRDEDPEFWLPADIFVNIQSADRSAITLGDSVARPIAVHTGEAKAPLTVSVAATHTPEVQIESTVPGWTSITHDGLRDVLSAVITALTHDSSSTVGTLALGTVGAPEPAGTKDVSIVQDLVRESGSDRVLLVAPDRSLTHDQLRAEVRSRAAVLLDRGVQPGDSVVVSVERDSAFVIWSAAIMAIGSNYVPVDTRHGSARLATVVAQSGARIGVLADSSNAPDGLDVVDRSSGTGTEPADLPELYTGLPAYVIFTSGTTGAPKGVPVTHANLLALRDATTDLVGPGDVVSAAHAFTFDFSVWEIWIALARGAQVVIYDEDVVRDPFLLADRLNRDGVTVLSSTNTALGSLLSARPALPSVRRVVLGGEQVSSAYVRQWFDTVGAASVVNMLGATETTVHTTQRFVSTDDLDGATVQVGEPLAHLDVVVVDDALRALPRGVGGEITVRGAGLALGYVGRGGLTASRFVPDPFPGALPGARLYLTGDLGQWLAAGELRVDGRIDSQVKVRGHRIEAAGVESVLDRLPGVRRSCVLAHDNRLIAFVDCAADVEVAELRAHASSALAAYEVPDSIHRVDAFPVTVNGKLDRSVHALFAAAGVDADRRGVASEDPFSAALTVALGDRIVDHGRSFLANGGDSILAVRLVSELRSRGVEVGVGDVLASETVGALAARIGASTPVRLDEAVLAPFALIDEAVRDGLAFDVADAYPLTAAQEGMLFHIRADAAVGVYHNTVSVRIRGGLDPLAFRVALADTIRRHEVLRTSIDEWSALEPLQLVHRHVGTPLTVVTVGDDEDADTVIDDLVAQERARPFDLERAPLFRITLVRVAAGEDQLIIGDSHIVLDGWSWTSTLAEVIGRHNALRDRDPDYDATVTALPVRFADFVAAEQRARASDATRAAWAAHLQGARPSLIADRRSRGIREMVRTEIDVEALTVAATDAGVSPRHLAMAVHVRAIGEVFGSNSVVTGVTSNGRLERDGGIDARGMFLNMIPMHLGASDDAADTARECARIDAAMADHRRLPSIDIAALVGKGPLFDFGFNFVRFHRLADIEATHTFGSKDTDSHFSQEDTDFALMATFSVHPPEHRLALMLIVDTARVSPDRHRKIVDAYTSAARWATHPNSPGETI